MLDFDPTEEREYTEDEARAFWEEARRMAAEGHRNFEGWRFPKDPDKNGFREAHLEGANLLWVHLEKANLRRAHLEEANLRWADLGEADLRWAHLERADLCWAHLEKGALLEAHLDKADLRGAYLEKACLREADLTGADLRGVYQLQWWLAERRGYARESWWLFRLPRKVSLNGIVGLRRRHPKLGRAAGRVYLLLAALSWLLFRCVSWLPEWVLAKMFGGRPFPFVLDDTKTRDALFDPNVADPWSVLRRGYSGPMFAIHLLALVAFLVPVVGRAGFWVGLGKVQQIAAEEGLLERATEPGRESEDAGSEDAKGEVDAIAEQLVGQAGVLGDEPDVRWRETRVFPLLIGWGEGYWLFTLAVSGVGYNIIRGWLTYRVGFLRDREQQNGRSPAKKEYFGLFAWHVVANYLVIVVVVSFVVNMLGWLSAPVRVPVLGA